MALTVATGLALDASGRLLGVPHPPFVGGFGVVAHPLLALAVVLFAAAVLLLPRLLGVRPLVFAAWILAATLVLRLVLAAGRTGIGAWTEVFDLDRSFEAKNEYLPALGALSYGPDYFLDRFAEIVPSLPVHAAGHPPGLLLTLHALGITTPAGMAALCIGAGALATPLTYLVARDLLGERRGRVAGLLMVLSPVVLVFGVTSPDALYMTLGIAAACLLTRPRDPRWLAAGAALLAVASFFAWSLLAVGAWAALLALRRDSWRAALLLSVVCGAALLAFYALLFALTGFDPLGTLAATESVYRSGVASRRPYAYWLFGSPTAFLVALGPPIVWFALRAARHPAALAILAVVAFSAVAGFTKAETERIWLLFAPLLCVAAAVALPRRALTPVLASLAALALVYEVSWETVW